MYKDRKKVFLSPPLMDGSVISLLHSSPTMLEDSDSGPTVANNILLLPRIALPDVLYREEDAKKLFLFL